MNKKAKGIMIAVIAGVTVFTSQAWADVAGAPGVPGSVDDPVVTKSYVDQRIQQVVGGGGNGSATGGRLIVEELQPGETLYGFEGTEFIVRTGKVQVVAGTTGEGFTDLTGGADMRDGAIALKNHLLLTPRSDSRGLRIAPDSKGKTYIIIRGQYQIQ